MLIYIFIACDRLDEKQEKQLKQNLPALQAALQTYVEANEANRAELINDCSSDDCEDWQLGISQPMKKHTHLAPRQPVQRPRPAIRHRLRSRLHRRRRTRAGQLLWQT
ncbi:hypothetical protein ULF88_01215 [Halopseudomonas pachastrellae]|nr:hypothetical protein [Halopseudomonas pachastrellae]